jgi:predicted enzyme related to lactoylglutathione lyase
VSDHAIVHVEIPAADPASAARFYGELFGWKSERDASLDYTMFRAGSGPGGGFPKLNEEYQTRPDSVMISVDTDDIEATLAKVEALGGQTVVPKSEIPNMGWFAVFRDPTGNRIGLWTARRQ